MSKWKEFRKDKSGYEVAECLMQRYVKEKDSQVMAAELEITRSRIMQNISLHIEGVRIKNPELYSNYKNTVLEVKAKKYNPGCTQEWINLKKHYRENPVDLAIYLMEYFCKFKNFDGIVEMSGLPQEKIRSSYMMYYQEYIKRLKPELFQQYEKVKAEVFRQVHCKQSVEARKKRSVAVAKAIEKKKHTTKSLKKVLSSMPEKIEYTKFIDMVINSDGDTLSVKELLDRAAKKGIEVYRITEKGFVRAN